MYGNHHYYQQNGAPGYSPSCPSYVTESDSSRATEAKSESILTGIETGASLTSLVDDLSCSPFSAELSGEDDPFGSLFMEKEQILRARVKHLADTLASRYELKDETISTLNYEQCKLQTDIWDLERWPLGIPQLEGNKAKLQGEMLRLEKDKKDEAASAWKDAFSVKSELLDAIKELRKTQNQNALFAEPPVSLPIATGYGEGLTYRE